MRNSIIKNIARIAAGLMLLFAAIICPFPTILAVSGIVWRIIIGLLGCFLLALGIYKIAGKK